MGVKEGRGSHSTAIALRNYANVLLSLSQLGLSILESCDYVPYTKTGKNRHHFETVPILTPLRAKAKHYWHKSFLIRMQVAGVVPQVVGCLPTMKETLDLIPSTT